MSFPQYGGLYELSDLVCELRDRVTALEAEVQALKDERPDDPAIIRHELTAEEMSKPVVTVYPRGESP